MNKPSGRCPVSKPMRQHFPMTRIYNECSPGNGQEGGREGWDFALDDPVAFFPASTPWQNIRYFASFN